MLQQYKLFSLPRFSILILCLIIAILLLMGKRSSQADDADKVVQHTVEASPADTLKYWTADKMRKAKPAEMPKVKAPRKGKKPPKQPRV